MSTVLSIQHVSKSYGPVRALNDVSFDIPSGTVFGILGPNGSGKTTLLGITMDILKADSGSYRLLEEEPTEIQRKQIGTLLETPNFYHYLSAVRNLRIAAAIKGRGHDDIERVLKVVNLWERKDSAFSTFSLGMKQRLAIGAALLGDPEVLMFDEPTNGLDPVGIAEIRELIKKLRLQGKTIIMASHLLDEVEKVCTHVAILKKGHLITHGDVNEILANEDIVELAAADNGLLKKVITQFSGYSNMKEEDGMIRLYFPLGVANLEALNKHCFNGGVILNHLQVKKKSLEAKFFELTN
ncbi:MAG: ATP-binding cassette domain-containing protein [Ferruginibacter sp.]